MRVCAVLGHRRPRSSIWNEGHSFGACPRCGRDLISASGKRWREPKGFAVVWRPMSDMQRSFREAVGLSPARMAAAPASAPDVQATGA